MLKEELYDAPLSLSLFVTGKKNFVLLLTCTYRIQQKIDRRKLRKPSFHKGKKHEEAIIYINLI